MSQAATFNVATAGPGTMSAFAGRLAPNLEAFLTLHSGAARPSYAVAHTMWLKIVSSSAWELYVYTGSADVLLGTLNPIAQTFTLSATALGFATSAVARNDVSPLSLVNGRALFSQGSNGEGLLKLLGRPTGNYDEAGVVFANGNTSAATFSLLAQQATSLRLLDSAGAEAMRFAATGDIVSALWGTLDDQIAKPGTIFFGPWTAAPGGSVKANGALLSRTTYARLWAAVQAIGKLVTEANWSAGAYGAFSSGDLSTNFRIPWIDGFFVRGVNSEASHTIGTYVADAFAAHAHGVTDPWHNHTVPIDGGSNLAGGSGARFANSGANPYTTQLTTDVAPTNISIQNAGSGTETKPRNVALLACIKI